METEKTILYYKNHRNGISEDLGKKLISNYEHYCLYIDTSYAYGAYKKDEVDFVLETDITFSVSCSTISIDAAGGDITISVTTNGMWNVVLNDDITVSDNTLKEGDGEIIITIKQNNTVNPKTILIEFANAYSNKYSGDGSTVSITQSGLETKEFSINPTELSLSNGGGAKSVTVSCNSWSTWTVEIPSYDYISITGETGTGDGTFTLTFTENTSSESTRIGNITINYVDNIVGNGSKTLSFTQDAAPEVVPDEIPFSAHYDGPEGTLGCDAGSFRITNITYTEGRRWKVIPYVDGVEQTNTSIINVDTSFHTCPETSTITVNYAINNTGIDRMLKVIFVDETDLNTSLYSVEKRQKKIEFEIADNLSSHYGLSKLPADISEIENRPPYGQLIIITVTSTSETIPWTIDVNYGNLTEEVGVEYYTGTNTIQYSAAHNYDTEDRTVTFTVAEYNNPTHVFATHTIEQLGVENTEDPTIPIGEALLRFNPLEKCVIQRGSEGVPISGSFTVKSYENDWTLDDPACLWVDNIYPKSGTAGTTVTVTVVCAYNSNLNPRTYDLIFHSGGNTTNYTISQNGENASGEGDLTD